MDHCILSILLIYLPDFPEHRLCTRNCGECLYNNLDSKWPRGVPEKVLVNNGGEFDNPLYLEAMEQYNIKVCATGASSPWSNRTCERNHTIIDLMADKILKDDPKMKIEVAVANVISAKNSTQNHLGFTPI